eukprot:CAMPEP_0194385826 /NCGR_PEP_ID=MMETSP0174-20130528/82716_1 /TAXON_ID=216777 /ORGANISM="Proboscia alata, Strain PI-D3" /LENGTH=851 /DNA_ID=CAMNT_0039174349 /DNA_START=108 /DNA_END=2663 /DNA_ORIENTATION=-
MNDSGVPSGGINDNDGDTQMGDVSNKSGNIDFASSDSLISSTLDPNVALVADVKMEDVAPETSDGPEINGSKINQVMEDDSVLHLSPPAKGGHDSSDVDDDAVRLFLGVGKVENDDEDFMVTTTEDPDVDGGKKDDNLSSTTPVTNIQQKENTDSNTGFVMQDIASDSDTIPNESSNTSPLPSFESEDGNTASNDNLQIMFSSPQTISATEIISTRPGDNVGEGDADVQRSIEMLRSEEISERIYAMTSLESIARVLGEDRCREELIPFLTESVDDEDEVLLNLSIMLGKLTPFVGGSAHGHVLLPPLEQLLMVEEATVREKAAASARMVASILPDSSFQDVYAEMISRLATKEWFTSRISACGLIATSFSRLSVDRKKSQILMFADLCRDEVSMVRRVASQNLGLLLTAVIQSIGFASLSDDGMVPETLIPLFEELATNDQDSVRLQTPDNCISFGKAMKNLLLSDGDHSIDDHLVLYHRILPLLVATIDDRSWRVRWTVASKFSEAVGAFVGCDGAVESLVLAFEKLLQDPEAEVRTAATFNLSDVAKCTANVTIADAEDASSGDEPKAKVRVAERLVKHVAALTDDESEHVRAALAMVATELAPILGKDSTISFLLPPLLLLLRDASSEVRLNLISSLSALNSVIGVDLLSQSLLPAIIDLAEDGKWRIRLAIIQHIPTLAKQLGKDFFSDKLSDLCVKWLGDDISSIREAAAINLMELVALFGADWSAKFLISSISQIREHNSYLRRLTAVKACSLMATKMDTDSACRHLLPLVVEMSTDFVPNIRFNVAKGLEAMAPVCGEAAYKAQIRPILTTLLDDSDRDVRYFSSKSLVTLEEKFSKNVKLEE